IEGNSILPEDVFKSSGHLEHFKDALPKEEQTKEKKTFSMMFDVKIGTTGKEIGYLSPETAQNAYLSFKREFFALREKLPFGLAIIGKAFRNEISPRQGFFRLREFTQAELQIFFDPNSVEEYVSWKGMQSYKIKVAKGDSTQLVPCETLQKKYGKFYVYHLAKIQQFYVDNLKIPIEKFRFREIGEQERAFYNKIHFDIELNLETLGGFIEAAGLHLRGTYDLKAHSKSGEKLEVTIDGKKVLPEVLELSFGVDRNIWALLDIFYEEEKERTLFKFPAHLSPFDVAVFPLVSNKKELTKKALEVYEILNKKFKVFYDDTGSIGRRYRRMDEIGCLSCITIDFDSLDHDDITLRERDSMKQIRVKIQDLPETLRKFLGGVSLDKLGTFIN
ncbi:glycine--tRNA ligase, partial [Candidatus Woesearchaeota archaeon]|nr:glycine--tRNA ligase [Candidatus Woesearchaeota archaeon]